MRREEAEFRNVLVFGEVRAGRPHPVTLELTGKAREGRIWASGWRSWA